MSSGFSGGTPDFFSSGGGGGRSTVIPTIINNNSYNSNLNLHHHQQQQLSLRSPLSGILTNPDTQIRRPEFIGKRPLADFQQQSLGFYLRNVKPRPYYQQQPSPISPLSPVDFSPVSSISNPINSRYGHHLPILQQNRPQPLTLTNPNLVQNRGYLNPTSSSAPQEEEEKKIMDHRLQELEKQLLGDEEENGEETVSVVTNSEWSQTIQNLLNPTQKPISSSPTSSTSSCSSTLASPPLPCSKQSLIDAAVSISEGKSEIAREILTRLQQVCNTRGTSEQRITNYMVSALKSRVNPTDFPPAVTELYSKEHALSTQLLYDASPCFKLGFMAANLSILEATTELGSNKIHVLDFDIGQGGQYVHLLHALAAAKKASSTTELKITAVTFSVSGEDEKLKNIGDRLKLQAQKIGVPLSFHVKNLTFRDLTREKLEVQSDEALAVNFAFKLYKLPDESVTTENLRDELLRRVKSLSPVVMTVVEQEMNTNTAPLATRVRDAREHYGAIFDSLDSTISRESPERVRIEEGLSRKICNSVACEGRDRLERCEVFGKWRARFSMAGFKTRSMSQLTADSLRSKLNSGTRGNPGFTVSEQTGGICFGWMGRTLAVASAWT